MPTNDDTIWIIRDARHTIVIDSGAALRCSTAARANPYGLLPSSTYRITPDKVVALRAARAKQAPVHAPRDERTLAVRQSQTGGNA